MEKLMSYGFVSDTDIVSENSKPIITPESQLGYQVSKVEELHVDNGNDHGTIFDYLLKKQYEENEEFEDEIVENIPLYDHELTFNENFEDGSKVKYVLLPIYKEAKDDTESFTPLLNAGAKVIMNRKNIMNDYSEGLNYYILDYDTVFGLRLLSFQRYICKCFSCDERVLFETLIIKYRRFGYRAFFYSFADIQTELGIKKDRAVSILNKFRNMGFVKSEIKTTTIDKNPRQVTYYDIDANKVIDLIPSIFLESFREQITDELTEYLKPAIKSESLEKPVDITRMQ